MMHVIYVYLFNKDENKYLLQKFQEYKLTKILYTNMNTCKILKLKIKRLGKLILSYVLGTNEDD